MPSLLSAVNQAGSGISEIGGAVGDLLSAGGDFATAKTYEQAAVFAGYDMNYARTQANISDLQAAREVTQGIGTETADVASAGFANSGSAINLLMSSAQQGAQTQTAVQTQGIVNVQQYQEQQTAYEGEAQAANAAGHAASVAGLIGIVGGLLNL